jgi:cell division protein FtsB
LKQGFDSSSTKLYSAQLVVPRAAFETLRIPTYVWVVTTLLALVLLVVAAMYREREGLRRAQASHQFTQQKVEASQLNNEMLRRDVQDLQRDKDLIARQAQEKLNYVRPNEVIIRVR